MHTSVVMHIANQYYFVDFMFSSGYVGEQGVTIFCYMQKLQVPICKSNDRHALMNILRPITFASTCITNYQQVD